MFAMEFLKYSKLTKCLLEHYLDCNHRTSLTTPTYLEIPLPLEASTKAQFLKQAVSRAAALYGPHPTPLQVKRSFPFYIICEETFFPKVYAV